MGLDNGPLLGRCPVVPAVYIPSLRKSLVCTLVHIKLVQIGTLSAAAPIKGDLMVAQPRAEVQGPDTGRVHPLGRLGGEEIPEVGAIGVRHPDRAPGIAGTGSRKDKLLSIWGPQELPFSPTPFADEALRVLEVR